MEWLPEHLVEIDYVNWRGERALRRIVPLELWFGSSEYHPDEQWLLKAWDEDKNAERDFALSGIKGWKAVLGK